MHYTLNMRFTIDKIWVGINFDTYKLILQQIFLCKFSGEDIHSFLLSF